MAIKINLKNTAIFITSVSPIIISIFFIIDSFLHMNINGLVWLVGIFISQLIAHLLRGSVINTMPDMMHPWIIEKRPAKPEELPAHDLCEIFEPMYESTRATNIIDTHTLFHSFTLIYLILGQVNSNNNASVKSTKDMTLFLIFYGLIAFGDIVLRCIFRCIPNVTNGVLYGLLSGVILGVLWWFLVYNITGKNEEKYTINGNSYIKKCNVVNNMIYTSGDGYNYVNTPKDEENIKTIKLAKIDN